MKLIHIPLFLIIGTLYGVGIFLIQGDLQKPVILTLITVSGIVSLASFFMIPPANSDDKAAPAQRFLIGTTIQILLSLAYLIYGRFKFGETDYKYVALHFVVLFIVQLIIQCILLVRATKK